MYVRPHVSEHDSPKTQQATFIKFGIYSIDRNRGFVSNRSEGCMWSIVIVHGFLRVYQHDESNATNLIFEVNNYYRR